MIDPSISLQGLGAQNTPVSAADTMGKWANLAQIGQNIEASKQQVEASKQSMLESQQNIEASKASQLNTEAQRGGLQADSEVKQRAIRFNDWIAKNRHLYTTKDGAIDTRALNAGASAAGFQQEGQAIGAKDLADSAQLIKNATDDQTRKIAIDKFTSDKAAHSAVMLSSLPEAERPAALRKIVDFSESLVPGSGQQTIELLADVNPQTGVVSVNNNKLAAVREATMTPLEKETLLVNQRNTTVGERNATTSAVNAQTGVRSQDLAETTAQPGYIEQTSNIIPTNVKSQAVITQADERSMGDQFKQASDLIKSAKIPKGNKAVAYISQQADKFGNDANLQSARALLADFQAKNPNVNINTMDGPTLAAVLEAQKNRHYNTAKNQDSIIKGSTFSGAPTKAIPGKPAAAPGPAMIPMINKQGHHITIPLDKLDAAIKDGYVKAGR